MASTKTTNAVISYLLEHGSSPRIDIAKALSITKASVTLVTNEMLEQGVIIEEGEIFEENKKIVRGRRKILLSINPDYKVTVGVVVLQGKFVIGITNLKGDVFAKNTISFTNSSQLELVSKILTEVDIMLKNNLIDIKDILACGVVFTESLLETVDGESSQIKISNIERKIEKEASFKVIVGTLAKSCLVAQRVFGDTTINESFMLISLIESVEIGLCINSSPYEGKRNCAGGVKIIDKALKNYRQDNDIESFAKTLSLCLSVIDAHCVYGVGDLFCDNLSLSKINDILADGLKIVEPVVDEKSLFIAGCGLALYNSLVV